MKRMEKLTKLLATGRALTISFYGLPPRPRQPASVYTYQGRFTLDGDRVRHQGMVCFGRQYTRHVSKIKSMAINDGGPA